MNLLFKFSIILLVFNGAGAFFGGVHLILHPDGSSLQLDPDLLEHTPFQNYLIPGIVLFLVNGVLSIATVVMLFFSEWFGTRLVLLQGLLLTGWIVVQMMLIQTVYFLHFVMGLTGILLMVFGWLLVNRSK